MTAALRAPVDVFNPCQRARIAELAAEHARTDLALQAIDWYIKAGLDEYQNGKIVLYSAQFAEHNKDYEIEEFLRGFIEMTGEGDPVFKYLLECLYERHASP